MARGREHTDGIGDTPMSCRQRAMIKSNQSAWYVGNVRFARRHADHLGESAPDLSASAPS
ncbi:MAG TPA: hypothetical protein VIU11_07095 [Nakamurella sp.]